MQVSTYQPGEDSNRLAETAKSFGLANARTPLKPVREAEQQQDGLSANIPGGNDSSSSFNETGSDSGNGSGHHRQRSINAHSQSIVKFGSAVRHNVGLIFSDSTLEAARMHSVGYLAKEERVAKDGSLHLMSISKRKRSAMPPTYGDLMDLFHQKPLEPLEVQVRDMEEEEDYEEVIMESVEGGTITAAIFGIIKGMVGPAVLYLPRGFAISGYAVAIPAMIVATLSYLYCSTRLLQAWKVESEKTRLRAQKMDEIQKLLDDAGGEAGAGGASGAGGYVYYGSTEDSDEDDSSRGRDLHSKNAPAPTLLTYPELAHRAFGDYSVLISGGIAAMQFGVCLTYLIFVPQNLYESARSLGLNIPKQAFLIAMLAIEIPMVWIRDIRKLAPINIMATLFIAFGLASVLYIALFSFDGSDVEGIGSYNDKYDNNTLTLDQDMDIDIDALEEESELSLLSQILNLPSIMNTWSLFIGTSFFCFEGSITLLVPLQEAVYSREDRERFPRVNNQVISSVVIFYVFFAIVCWASFGDAVQTALTASLPQGILSTAVQIAYSIAVVFTFPLQAFPALEVVTNRRNSKGKSEETESTRLYKRNITASIIVCCLGFLAVLAIDYLGNVVSLLGSLVGIPIALIYPPLIHNKLVKDSSRSTRMMNYCLSIVGVFAAGAASYTTLSSWGEGAEG
mmetsp:Transcript_25182/g.37266  ORF Transcript_25182/g.37266 Transcript_25182/m.37266 type:complete len:680 (+) Transcript_25182:99-2138(+)